jgi:hypothetical protein
VNIDGHLVKAIVDIAIFLEYTDSEFLDEDIAIEAMEQFAAELQQMADQDRRQLAKQIVGLSPLYVSPQSEFIHGLPGALGLA